MTTKEAFKEAFDFICKWERHLSYDPYGGVTIWGLASKYHPEVLEWRFLPAEEARKKAAKVYKKEYWDKLDLDSKPYPLNVVMFNAAVQSAPQTCVEILQKALNNLLPLRDFNLVVDGIYGPKTDAALKEACQDPSVKELLIRIFLWSQLEDYASLHRFNEYGRGWTRRLIDLLKYIKRWKS